MTSRRNICKTIGALALVPEVSPLFQSAAPAAVGPFNLPSLPYAVDALEPYIDARTIEIHHDRHHAAYVTNLNNAVAKYPELARRSVEDLLRELASLPEAVRTVIRNSGGGHANHTLFWQTMAREPKHAPTAPLAQKMDRGFGSFDGFKEQFTKAALSVFGSGWAWLSVNSAQELSIETTPNQDTPLMSGRTPLFGIDVWEHAYYLKYQNRRAEYVAAFYNVINWDFIGERYEKLGLKA